MCGICGKVVFRDQWVDGVVISRMCSTLSHRGPDDEGIYVGPHIGLGQRRLAVIDLSKDATGPLANEDQSIWLVFNGEIYNFRELRASLTKQGHTFRTATDTEVIVHLYEEYGTECLSHLRGMFAFAIWDIPQSRLFAARDPLGKKPFCFTKTSTAFIFGSEIKAITADSSVTVEPNFEAINAYLTYQYVPSPLTAFVGINKLPAGHYLTCSSNGDINVVRYWSPNVPRTQVTLSGLEIEEELQRHLRIAVRRRLVSDVPLGALLSGGIDSSSVVAIMAEESSRPVKTFSARFDETEFDETPYARETAQLYGTDHHELLVTPNLEDLLPLLVWHYNEPFADSSAVPTFLISGFTRKHVTVALTGDGGDECFGGYEVYRRSLFFSRWIDGIPLMARRAPARQLRGAIGLLPYHRTIAKMDLGLSLLEADFEERYVAQMTTLRSYEKKFAYSAKFKTMISGRKNLGDPILYRRPSGGRKPLDWMMAHDQTFYLPDCLMVKSDIASMAHGLEMRCPLMDQDLVEFAAGIPPDLKRKGGQSKWILKSAMKSKLPASILQKKKTGFSIPLAKWLRGPLAPMVREALFDGRLARRGFFDERFLRVMVDENGSGRKNWSSRIWAVLFLELWFRRFID